MKNYLFSIFVAFTVVVLLSGCSSDLRDYEATTPQFDIKTYFTGNVVAWGMLQDRQQKVTRRFCVNIVGSWQGNKGILDETFYFDDGERQTRVWQLEKLSDGRYQGTAGDVVGTASGAHKGFAFFWQYTLSVPIDGEQWQFTLDDWMYQMDETRLFNRTKMKKFGLTVAEITLFFEKKDTLTSCSEKSFS